MYSIISAFQSSLFFRLILGRVQKLRLTTKAYFFEKYAAWSLQVPLFFRFWGEKYFWIFCAGSIFRSVLVLVWLQSEWEKSPRAHWLPRSRMDQSARAVLHKRISTKICAQVHTAHLFLHLDEVANFLWLIPFLAESIRRIHKDKLLQAGVGKKPSMDWLGFNLD